MRKIALACCALLALLPQFGCGGAAETSAETRTVTPAETEFVCAPTDTVVPVTDLNSPSDCSTAASAAEERLDGHHYTQACREALPESSPAPAVTSAHVTDCRTTDDRGVFLDVEVCCSESVVAPEDPADVFRADGPDCPTWRTRARASDLHYPEVGDCAEIVSRAENDHGISFYRNACKRASPRATRPIGVLDARVVECRSGGGLRGVVVDVELCCDGKVFEENEFKRLVWQRPQEEVRAMIGEPLQVTEWPQGLHWNYPLEVARDEQVFPEVTVVIVDGRVESYFF